MNLKREFGLTEKQCLVLVAMLRYFRWYPGNSRRIGDLTWNKHTGRPIAGFTQSYYGDMIHGQQLAALWNPLSMGYSRTYNAALVMRKLSEHGLTKFTHIKGRNGEFYWKLTELGEMAATTLELSLLKRHVIHQLEI